MGKSTKKSATPRKAQRAAPQRRPGNRRDQRTAANQRTFMQFQCEACGLGHLHAPFGTRWIDGVALELCHECCYRPQPQFREKRDAVVAERLRDSDDSMWLDREEIARDLVRWADMYVGTDSQHVRGCSFEDACAEWRRVHELATRWLPESRNIRAGRAAQLRGLTVRVNEKDPAAASLLDCEREDYARSLFSGFCQAWRVPIELRDWLFDSAAKGELLPLDWTGKNGYRLEPRLGPYIDHDRHDHPPCITWGRHTSKAGRGAGRWVTALQVRLKWNKPKKSVRYVDIAPENERLLHYALIAEANERGFPDSEGEPEPRDFGIDREELKYRLHRRLCAICAAGEGESEPRAVGRRSHVFHCLGLGEREAWPGINWIDDQLDREWNNRVLFQIGWVQLTRRPAN